MKLGQFDTKIDNPAPPRNEILRRDRISGAGELIPMVGHDTPQEATAAVTAAVLDLIRSQTRLRARDENPSTFVFIRRSLIGQFRLFEPHPKSLRTGHSHPMSSWHLSARGYDGVQKCYDNLSRRAFALFKSRVSNPSVNQL